jgi:hypothetical protein
MYTPVYTESCPRSLEYSLAPLLEARLSNGNYYMFYLSLYLLHWFSWRVLWWYVYTHHHNTGLLLLLCINFLTGVAYI